MDGKVGTAHDVDVGAEGVADDAGDGVARRRVLAQELVDLEAILPRNGRLFVDRALGAEACEQKQSCPSVSACERRHDQ